MKKETKKLIWQMILFCLMLLFCLFGDSLFELLFKV